MKDMIEMFVDSIRVSLTTQQRVLMLRDADHTIYLPIWIGSFEAESIVVGLQEIEVSRPQTHDLLVRVILATRSNLKHVELSKIQNETFYSFLVLEQNEEEIRLDCRPSDAISLAIRFKVPIYVNTEVVYRAGIQPEKDVQLGHDTSEVMEGNEYDGSLSVFDDFLQKLDIEEAGKDDDETGGGEPDDPGNPSEQL
jgi:bifunctional DNase/RNase